MTSITLSCTYQPLSILRSALSLLVCKGLCVMEFVLQSLCLINFTECIALNLP